jgi:hypothetical protein
MWIASPILYYNAAILFQYYLNGMVRRNSYLEAMLNKLQMYKVYYIKTKSSVLI